MQKVRQMLRRLHSEEGAVTIDWVVLTALLVPLGMIVGTMIWGETERAGDRVAAYILPQTVLVPDN